MSVPYQLDTLASIKSKNELIADVVALLQSPAKNVVSALTSGGTKLHGILETLSNQIINHLRKITQLNHTKMADLKAFAEQLVNLSVKEVNELASDP